MRRVLLVMAGLALFAIPVSAQTAEEIVARYIKTIGAWEDSGRQDFARQGKYNRERWFEAVHLDENNRQGWCGRSSRCKG